MTALQKVDEIATEVARRYLGKDNVVRVNSRDSVDFYGDEALRIQIVLAPEALDRIGGKAASNTLSGLQIELQKDGEDRFAYVEFATMAELEEADLDQSDD